MKTDNRALQAASIARLPMQWPMIKAGYAATRTPANCFAAPRTGP